MKILQICSAREIGGGETHLADLSNALAARGHQMFYALAPESPVARRIQNLLPENVLFTRMRNALDVLSARGIARFASQNEVEIIQAHLARDYPLAALAARFSGKPFVLTRHVLFPLKRLHKYALKNVSGVIAPSHAVANSLRKQRLFSPDKIETIYNGIDLNRFTRANQTNEQKTFLTVGTVGHLSPIKGHDIFIRAAKLILQKRQDVKFVIVGEDKSRSGENRRALEDLIAALDLQEHVEITGWSEDIRSLLDEFDLFVSAARSEPFGLVIVEAMASEIPAIATESEGAREIIENETSGVLIPLENPESLAQSVLDLAADAARRKQLATAGRERVEKMFSIEKMVSQTEQFYCRILQKKRLILR
jgi:glycosyltransferase involved in cell wall biosynthesis